MADEQDLFIDPDNPTPAAASYNEDDIQSLSWEEQLRLRPGMYIGKTGDGTSEDDGIYVLLKEVLDNSIDEFMNGAGRRVVITIEEGRHVTVRDYGRGIPLGSVVNAAGRMNVSGKYKEGAFKKTIGLNGVGLKAVNALSSSFVITSFRDGVSKQARFSRGILLEELPEQPTTEENGTLVEFTPDDNPKIFGDFRYLDEFVIPKLKNDSFLCSGLTIVYNGQRMYSRGGLLDLLHENMSREPLYPPIHLKGNDIELALTHAPQYGEEYYTFVNSQYTSQGGTHLTALKEVISRTLREFFGRNFDAADIRNGIVGALSIRVQDPIFESQTKVKLGSREVTPGGMTVAKFVGDFVKKELDNYLHKNPEVKDIILKKIQQSERERRAMAGITKLAREKAKKVSVNNKKLLDCRIHLNDPRGDEHKREASSIFITEGDSAAGSITKIRDAETQAVFSLRGKPKNTFGLTQKIVYENEEFNLLQAALNIEEGLDGLRYNKVIIATDADVDGMHIRLLLLTFFLQFFPDLVKKGHVYVLQTPLFRVRDKKATRRSGRKKGNDADDKTFYCYTDEERIEAIDRLGDSAEITRFKGLGEISPEEFATFIGPDMRVDRVNLRRGDAVEDVLEFYMGKNTPMRQEFIIENLRVEDDSEIS